MIKWSESTALEYLENRGISINRGIITMPANANLKEISAIDYLVHEWDYEISEPEK